MFKNKQLASITGKKGWEKTKVKYGKNISKEMSRRSKMRKPKHAKRDWDIRTSDLAPKELARKYKITHQRVYQIKNG